MKPGDTPRYWSWRLGRTSLIFATALTTLMVCWQGYHLYDRYRVVAERDSGDCPTRAVEAAYSAGERLDYLTDEIEHSFLIWGSDIGASPIAELGERFDATDAELAGAIDRAEGLSKGKVLAAVVAMDAARVPLRDRVDTVLGLVEDGRTENALAAMGASVSFRDSYDEALDGMWVASREHLVRQLERERSGEVLSVGVALLLFALAVGAWGVFLRQIKRGQARLWKEEQQRHRAEEELLQSQKMDALGLMASGIAHDFSNLITAVQGSAASAKEQLSPEHPAIPALQRIEDASDQANSMVTALLTFSRRTEAADVPVDVSLLADSVARILEPMMPGSIDLEVDCASAADCWVSGDATQLTQALINLALNAMEAMPRGGRLGIRCGLSADGPGSRVIVEVVDTGEGMTPEVVDQMFTPFFTTRAPGQGTGLGLSITHGIVTNHGGNLLVESESGKGTTVSIDLPAIEPPVLAEGPTAPESIGDHRGDGLVLLVEDHRHVREIIAETLESAGFDVIHAATGKEYLTLCERWRDSVRLLIVDVDIPPPNGVTCIEQLRAQGVKAPAIAITGTAAPGLEQRLGGKAVVLRKPFTMTRLAAVASSLVAAAAV